MGHKIYWTFKSEGLFLAGLFVLWTFYIKSWAGKDRKPKEHLQPPSSNFPACPWVKVDSRNKAETLGWRSTFHPRYQIERLPFMLLVKISLGWTSRSSSFLSSVQFSRSVVSDSLRPHESQHARPPCPSPIPGVHSNSCSLSRWCHPVISSSVVPFSSCPKTRPASGSFPVSQLFAWGGQSIAVSALASVLPMNTQDWSPLGWTGWISLQSKGLSRVFSNTTVQKHQFFGA